MTGDLAPTGNGYVVVDQPEGQGGLAAGHPGARNAFAKGEGNEG